MRYALCTCMYSRPSWLALSTLNNTVHPGYFRRRHQNRALLSTIPRFHLIEHRHVHCALCTSPPHHLVPIRKSQKDQMIRGETNKIILPGGGYIELVPWPQTKTTKQKRQLLHSRIHDVALSQLTKRKRAPVEASGSSEAVA